MQCTDCGARVPGLGTSSRWHSNYSVCDSCYQQRNKGIACPICGRAYRHSAQKEMLQVSLSLSLKFHFLHVQQDYTILTTCNLHYYNLLLLTLLLIQAITFQCNLCKRHVHGACDPESLDEATRNLKFMYVCKCCKSGVPPLAIRSHNPSGGSAHSGSSPRYYAHRKLTIVFRFAISRNEIIQRMLYFSVS